MAYQIFTIKHATVAEFITFWQQLYDYGNEKTYDQIIRRGELNQDDVVSLFLWKNNMGMKKESLSGSKKIFVQKVLERLDKVNQLKKSFDLANYLRHFEDLPAVWGILLLHVVSSGKYPIYDQHVHRAFSYCVTGLPKELPVTRQQRYKVYLNGYVPFFENLRRQVPDVTSKQVDEALWSLGKFLSRYPQMMSPYLSNT